MDGDRLLSTNCISGHEGYIAGAIITFYLENLNVHYLLNQTFLAVIGKDRSWPNSVVQIA
jgi:hypothetical protein